jgi:hypothetical protein
MKNPKSAPWYLIQRIAYSLTSEVPLYNTGLSAADCDKMAAGWEGDTGEVGAVGKQVHRAPACRQGRVSAHPHPPLLLT